MKIQEIHVDMIAPNDFGMSITVDENIGKPPWRHAVRAPLPESPEELKKELCRMVDALWDWNEIKARSGK